ncbi:hypothetical protein AB835_09455 [Candidatus Endobugula sertula]|uniref:Uncharacterized protein n=1 Tax=Candidatus Endobugula sertula TaxID=62101 RepID=A0A1D2QP24_9GAMM|nr:hypothetical protein AB835_09455 [Candidatus Endobugula sertula]
MAKHLSGEDIENILGLIDGWDGKLTWDALCDASMKLVGKRPTRQSLNANLRIKQAFVEKKSRLKDQPLTERKPNLLLAAAQRIRRLEEENARLNNENSNLLEKFVVWQYNAYRHGLTEEKLSCPLPVIDRTK